MGLVILRVVRSIFAFVFILSLSEASAQIYINELQAYNASSYLEREWGNFPDWIELYNGGADPVNISGYFISDDRSVPDKWELPSETIYPGGFELIFADKVAYRTHTNFSLSGQGEQLMLFSPELELVDSVAFGQQYPDISFGRYPDGSQSWRFFEDTSPKEANSSENLVVASFADSVQFSLPGGFYTSGQTIAFTTPSPTAVIGYTLDGSDPTASSPIYGAPLDIQSTTVVRAKVFDDGLFSSPTVTQTYILDKEISLPVISISADWDYLWDDQVGIYVEGTNGIVGNCSETPVNFNQDWERPINIEYFDQQGNSGFNQVAGTKIFGTCSRRAVQKSLSIFARGKYGKSEFDYKLFKDKKIDKFKSFIIRNSGNDIRHTMLRDGMMHTLVKDRMDIDYQEYQPAIIYLNGKYWGILNIREKINEDYLESNHGIDPDSVDMLMFPFEVIEGDDFHYQNMMKFVRSKDMSDPGNYAHMGTLMDINQFLNYFIAEIYFKNLDWPVGNNKFWRPQTPGGRWRWLLYDTDFGFDFRPNETNMVKWVTAGEEPSTELFRELAQNEDFQNLFVQRFCSHINTSFQPGRVIAIIDSLAANIEAEMPDHMDEFYWPGSMSNWHDELKILTDFAAARLPVLTRNLKSRFSLDGTYELTATVSNPAFGRIQICGVDLPPSMTGSYFRNIPISVKAIPAKGYTFLGWEGASTSGNNEIELILAADASVTAHFGQAVPLNGLHFNEVSSSGENAIADEFGELTDWIELHNSGNVPVQLAGLFLTDTLPVLAKHWVSFDNITATRLLPDSTLLLYADNQPSQGPLHLNFKLNNSGETLALVQRIGDELIILDSIGFKTQHIGATMGRIPDGGGNWQLTLPTPGDQNRVLPTISGLFINEFSASNGTFNDGFGEFDDWIEIYNDNDSAVDIGGLFMTDSLADGRKYRIPKTYPDSTTIPPHGYLLLWADNQPGQGILHLGFGLSREGEQIGLVHFDGTSVVDSIAYGEQYPSTSMSRFPDGEAAWRLLPSTPGSENRNISVNNLYINEFSASNGSIIADDYGEFDDWIEIYNDNDFPVDMGGLFLTDSLADETKSRIPSSAPDSTTIPAKGYLLFWADNQASQGILHLDFRIRRSGEQIGLVQYNGVDFIDSLTFMEQYNAASMSRYPDGETSWYHIPPTPGAKNIHLAVPGLYINEFSANNQSIITDEYGESDDWIEIYNAYDESINIGGLFITDSLAYTTRYRIPTTSPDSTTIPGKGFLILWADNQPDQGVLHLGFGLKRTGEQVGLIESDGSTYIDSLTYRDQYLNASFSRYPDGEQVWHTLPSTPGKANIYRTMSGLYINEFSASNLTYLEDSYGEYDDWIEIYNDNEAAVDLGGVYLTDSLAYGTRFRIPSTCPDSTTIPSKGHLLFWADKQVNQGILHLNFGLKRSGEQIGIVDFNGLRFIDSLSFDEQSKNSSQSRYPDGQSNWYTLPSSPGESNVYRVVSGIYINEFSSSNRYLMRDNYGEYDDWVELYNSTNKPVDIGGLFITDSLADATKYRIPTTAPDSTTVPANGFIVLWADNQAEQGILHLDFGLTRTGEQIGVAQYNGIDFIDTLTYNEILVNTSLSRYPDGDKNWLYMTSTPGTSNLKNEYKRLYINEFRAGDPSANSTAQYYDGNWIELFNNNEYSIDIGGLYLTDSLSHPNKFMIPNSDPGSTTIPPKGYLLLWTDKQEYQGLLHLNFILNQDGTQIGLARKVKDRYVYIDTLVYTYQNVHVSTGRVNDGVNSWTNFSDPTPGRSNTYALTSVPFKEGGALKVYPNPVSDGFIYFSDQRNVKLYNQLGTLVEMKTNADFMNVSSLPAGFYLLKTDQGEVSQVVVQ